MEFVAKSVDDLAKISHQLWELFQHKVVLFEGDLGSGKTALIKALIHHKNQEVIASSPSFSIVNEYPNGNENIYHMDLYRLEKLDEIYNIGVLDYLDSGQWVFIEWPQLISSLIPENHHVIKIDIMENWSRKIIFN